jgi:hypothetical protein
VTALIPPNNLQPGDPLHIFYHNNISDVLTALSTSTVLLAGADPTGVADSTAAFQAAISALPAGGGTITVPPGTYKCNTGQLTVVSGLHLVAPGGYGATTINCTAGGAYLFNLDPPGYSTTVHVEDLLISGFTINATGMDIFWGANIVRSRIVNNFLNQKSAGNAIMNVSQSTGTNGVTYLAENEFANKEFVGGTPRAIEAWHLDCSGTGLRCNDNLWHGGGNKIWAATDGDTTRYWLVLMGSPAGTRGSRHNVFRDLIFELPNGTGGLINLQNVDNAIIDNLSSEDLSTSTVGNALISLGSLGGDTQGTGTTVVSNYSRRGGTGISNSVPDILLDSHCNQITIKSPSVTSGGAALNINLGSATNVVRSGAWPLPASYTLQNAAGLAPQRGVFQPSSPGGTVSATLVMMGVGSTCALTPQGTGQVLINVTGSMQQATAGSNNTIGGRYGTGTAPTNGTAVTGTRFGAATDPNVRPATAAAGYPFAFTDLLSLTPGTAYWFDLAVLSGNANSVTLTQISMTIVEQ